jgi:hypothetical protein
VSLFVAATAIAANAQFTTYNPFQSMHNLLVNRAIGDAIVCDSYRKAGRKDPPECARSGRSSTSTGRSTGSAATRTKAGVITGPFTTTTGADSFEKIAATISNVPQEKQLIIQTAAAMNSTLDQTYGPRGWKNNVAGAIAFFTVSMLTVYYDKEPSEAVQNALFDSYNTGSGTWGGLEQG